MAAGRKRREQDAVMHKVLGASRRDVLSIFVLEYGLLAAYAALIAVLIGLIGGWLIIRSTLQVSFDPSPALILLIALGGAIATLASGALTTWRSLSKSPAAVLRQA
jgi:putative ABC transport system permease protein